MKHSKLRLIAAVVLGLGTIVSGYFGWQTWTIMSALNHSTPAAASTDHAPAAVREPSAVTPPDAAPVIIAFEEVVVNVGPQDGKTHMLIMKLDLELFEESSRKLIEKRQGGVKHTILELSRVQNIDDLGTLSGKLYFKEQVISALNTFLNQPAVRDIHFASFLLR